MASRSISSLEFEVVQPGSTEKRNASQVLAEQSKPLSLRGELIRSLYEQATPSLLIDAFALLSICMLVLDAGAPRSLVLPWAIALAMMALGRYMLANRQQEACADPVAMERGTTGIWHLAYVATAVPYGLTWGAAAFILLVPGQEYSYVLVSFLLCGLGAGAIVVYSASWQTICLFITALFAPFMLRLSVIDASSAHLTLVIALLWAGFAVGMGIRAHIQLVARIRQTSHIRGLADQLDEARFEAERKSEAKSVFVAKVNHELRTPLNAIIGFTEAIQKRIHGEMGNPRYAEYIDNVNLSGRHLYRLITDLLDLSRLEAGKLELHEEKPLDLRHLLQECKTMAEDQAAEAGISVRLSLPDHPIVFNVDETRLRQVVINLLTNAIKFSPRDTRIDMEVRRGEEGTAEIRVRDHGAGMPAGSIDQALDAFEQLPNDAQPQAEQDGLGLGLTIARRLTEAHGGQLEVTSALNRGTMVLVRLPEERRVTSEPIAAAPPPAEENSAPAAPSDDADREDAVAAGKDEAPGDAPRKAPAEEAAEETAAAAPVASETAADDGDGDAPPKVPPQRDKEIRVRDRSVHA